jgi:hypothetical protein
MMVGVNLTKRYYKHFCKCHSVPQYNNNIIKNEGQVKKGKGKKYLVTYVFSVLN